MQLTAMEQTATRVSALLKLLSHRDRLMALCHLAQGEMAAGKLGEAVGMKAPAMSQQLAILRREGIIASRREGQTIFYRIVDRDAVTVMNFLYETFCAEGEDIAPDSELQKEEEPA